MAGRRVVGKIWRVVARARSDKGAVWVSGAVDSGAAVEAEKQARSRERDGLYWKTTADEPPSPLGLFLVLARAEGYELTADNPIPYHGYYYKILTSQGANAPGEAYDYVVRDVT